MVIWETNWIDTNSITIVLLSLIDEQHSYVDYLWLSLYITSFQFIMSITFQESRMTCIIHYEGSFVYSQLQDTTETNIQRILEVKAEHEIRNDTDHLTQCNSVPDTPEPGKTQIHLKPCYNKFCRVLRGRRKHDQKQNQDIETALPKTRSSSTVTSPSSSRSSSPS